MGDNPLMGDSQETSRSNKKGPYVNNLLEQFEDASAFRQSGNQESVVELQQVHHQFYDRDDMIEVDILVTEVDKESLLVNFCPDTVQVTFQTRDAQFLKLYEGSTEKTKFSLAFKLKGQALEDKCSFQFYPLAVNLKIRKKLSGRSGNQNLERTESVVELQEVHHQFYDRDDMIVLDMYVNEVDKDSLMVNYFPDSLHVRFQTRDVQLLKLYKGSTEETKFSWTIGLRSPLLGDKCWVEVNSSVVTLKFKKRVSDHWGDQENFNRTGLHVVHPRGQESTGNGPKGTQSGGREASDMHADQTNQTAMQGKTGSSGNLHDPGIKEVTVTAEESGVKLQEVSHRLIETNDMVEVEIKVSNVGKDSLVVNFCPDTVHVRFQTRDTEFLKLHEGSTEKTKFSWSIRLKGQTQEDKCSFKVYSSFVYLKISKKVPGRWGDQENLKKTGLHVVHPRGQESTGNGQIGSRSFGPGASDMHDDQTNQTAVLRKTRSSGNLHDDPSKQPVIKEVTVTAEESVVELQHVHHIFTERDDKIVVKMYVKELDKASPMVNFCPDTVHVKFQTRDAEFLKLHEGSTEETKFSWTIRLKGQAQEDKCSFDVYTSYVYLKIAKKVSGRWGDLENLKRTESVVQLQHVSHTFTERDDMIVLDMYVNEVDKDSLMVNFCPDTLNVRFQTRDAEFLKLYKGTTEETKFSWTTRLGGLLLEDKGLVDVNPFVSLKIRKKVSDHWEDQENFKRTGSKTNQEESNTQKRRVLPETPETEIGNSQPRNQDTKTKDAMPGDDQGESKGADTSTKHTMSDLPDMRQNQSQDTTDEKDRNGLEKELKPETKEKEAREEHPKPTSKEPSESVGIQSSPSTNTGTTGGRTGDSTDQPDTARQKRSRADGGGKGQASPSPGSTGDSHDGSTEQPVKPPVIGTGQDTADVKDILGSQDSVSSLDSFEIIDPKEADCKEQEKIDNITQSELSPNGTSFECINSIHPRSKSEAAQVQKKPLSNDQFCIKVQGSVLTVQDKHNPRCKLVLPKANDAHFEGELLCVDGSFFDLFVEEKLLKCNEVQSLNHSGEQNGKAVSEEPFLGQETQMVGKQGNCHDMFKQDDHCSEFRSQSVKQKRKELIINDVPKIVVKVISKSSFKSEFSTKFPDAEIKAENVHGSYANIRIMGSWDCSQWFQKEIHYCQMTFDEVKNGGTIPKLPDIMENYLLNHYDKLGTVLWDIVPEKKQIFVWCSSTSPSAEEVVHTLKRAIKKAELSYDCDDSALATGREKIRKRFNVLHEELHWNTEGCHSLFMFCFREDYEDIKKEMHNIFHDQRKTHEESGHSTDATFNDHRALYSIENGKGQAIAVSNEEVVNLKADVTVVLKEKEIIGDACKSISRNGNQIVVEYPQKGHEQSRAKHKVAESMKYALVEIKEAKCFKVAVACSKSNSWANGYKYLKFVLDEIFKFFEQNSSIPYSFFLCTSDESGYRTCQQILREGKRNDYEETSSTNDELAHAPEGVDQNSDTVTSTAAKQLAAEKEASRSANETTGESRAESSKLKVYVLKEEIISVKADAIVNSTSDDLNLENGYVSAKINRAAGKKLQKAVHKEAKMINFWDYIVTKAFDLSNCKHIFHCALEPLKDIDKNDQKDVCLSNMRAMVRMLLNEANKMSCHSIALPALGTGNLGYHPKDAANAIFLAVCDFVELNGDTSHLQEIKIVIYEKEENTFQAFKKVQAEMAQEMGGRAKQPVPAFYFKERRLEAIVGSPDIINCDTVVCLLDNSNLKQGKSKDHPIICKLPSKTVQDWNKKRHSKGKFFSLNGAPWNCLKILTMEMREKEKLQSVIKQSLLHADVEMKSFSVVFYFEETNVCLQRGKNLMKDFMEAFYDYGPTIERLMKVTVLLDGTQNATRVFEEFSNQASVSKPSTVNRSSPKEQKKSFQDDQKKKSKEEKGMTQETRPPPRPPLPAIDSASSNSGSNRYRGNILKGWDPQRFLETDEVAMLVLVKGILPTETEEEVMFNLKKFVPEKKFELHFCPGMLSATLSFDTPQDADDVVKHAQNQTFQYQIEKHPAEVLMKYEFSLTTKEVKEIESTEQIETFQSHFKQPIITFKANKDKTISFECKTKFALELVEMAKTYYTTKHIKMEAVSENILDVFSTKKKESIEHLKTDGGIVECDSATGKVNVSIPNLVLEKYKELEEYLKRITDSKNFGGSREFFIETYQTQKAQAVCQDLERTVTCECAYVPDKQLIVVLVEKYEHIKHVGNKIRDLLKGKPSEVKPTGRAGRKRHTDDSSNNAESNKACASGGVHFESGKKIFQTKEKIDVHVYEGNILKLDVDCIVNAANDKLQHAGGVASAIARKAGYQLTKESEEYITKHGSIPVGCAVSTSAGNLSYECVIHTVGPRWSDYSNQSDGKNICCQKLYEAIMSSLQIAADKGMKSIALPAISSAIFGVPLDLCVVEYRQAVFDFSRTTGAKLKEIHFVDIKADVVKSIQDEFCNLQQTVDENRFRQYELNKPMSFKSSLKRKPRHSSDNENSGMHLKFKKVNDTTVALINEPFHKLEILKGDLSAVDTDAVVLTIDENGKPRRLTKVMQGKFHANHLYYNELQVMHNLKNTTGNVIATGGCGSKYKSILHVILPCNLKYKENKEKEDDLNTAYAHIFDEMSKYMQPSKVSTVLLGKGDNDVTFCASILWKSFHAFCRKELKGKAVHVVVVCYDSDEFEATRTAILEDALRETPSHSHDETDLNKDTPFAQSALENEDEDCVICMDTVKDPYPLKCGHMFCKECILKQFEFKKVCPMCGHVCGTIEGNQPTGKMIVSKESGNIHGYWNCGSILMRYEFPDGKQQEGHPNPGTCYRGIRRTGYLPDNAAGKTICQMMKIAFKRKLVFTIGNSRTTGREGVITWNDIHHKTDPKPNTQFGYPDDTYLARVKEELEIKGVTEKDIDSKSRLEGVVYTN